jgi:hypothetical protein
MSNFASKPIDMTERQTIARQRESAIVLLNLVLFAGGVATCAALTTPILWTAINEAVQRPTPTYRHCLTVEEDVARLSCFDHITRQKLGSKLADSSVGRFD